jgi:HSP20 family protein
MRVSRALHKPGERPPLEDVIEVGTPVFTEPPYSALTANVYETPERDAYVIEIPAPGLKPDEIDVRAEPYTVTVSTRPAPAEPEPGRRYIVREQPLRPMWRRLDFPVEIDPGKVEARLEYGMLRVVVPKAEAARGKTVRVERAA